MMKRLRHSRLIIAVACAAYIGGAGYAAAQSTEAIDISRSDFLHSPEEIMKDVARLETMAASSVATAEYARAYEKLQASLGKANPPVSEWSQSNRERLRELPEPSEAAWKSLELEMQRQQQRANQQSQTAQQRFEQAQLLREQETRQRLEEQRLSLDAEEQAARIRELDARTDYLDDAPYYNHVYDNLWWQRGHKWRPGSHIKWRSGLKQEKINHGLSDEFRHLRTTERPARHNGHRR